MTENANPGKKKLKIQVHGAAMNDVPPAAEHVEQAMPEGTLAVLVTPTMARMIVALAAKYRDFEDPDIQLLVGPLEVIAEAVKAGE